MVSYRAAVVSAGGSITGVVGEDIAVLPDMHPSRSGQAWDARAVVAEVGGPLAHMALVAREMNKTMMVMSDACTLLRPGTRVTLIPARCEIQVHDD